MRLFVALDIPEQTREALRQLIDALKPATRVARWVRPEGIHITLKFIGHVADDRLDSFVAALASSASTLLDASMQPVDMRFRGLGFFPGERRPRVLWCGVDASPDLAQLALDVERALQPLGIAPEARPFAPHLTLARSGRADTLAQVVPAGARVKQQDFGSARATEFHLFESKLKLSGSEYKKLHSFSFAKEPYERP